jgi:hypothetical protein
VCGPTTGASCCGSAVCCPRAATVTTHPTPLPDPPGVCLLADDQTGKISFRNLKRVAKELGENMTDEELQEMIDEADRDGDSEINEEEFLRIMKKTSLY